MISILNSDADDVATSYVSFPSSYSEDDSVQEMSVFVQTSPPISNTRREAELQAAGLDGNTFLPIIILIAVWALFDVLWKSWLLIQRFCSDMIPCKKADIETCNENSISYGEFVTGFCPPTTPPNNNRLVYQSSPISFPRITEGILEKRLSTQFSVANIFSFRH